jgi:hypothetical protein
MNKDLNTPVWQLTTGELLEMLAGYFAPEQPAKPDFEHSDRYVYQIAGIAKLLGVSNTMVHEYRKQGWIDSKTGQMPYKQLAGGVKGLDSYGRIQRKTIDELAKELASLTKETGRYHIDWVYREKEFGHIITLEKLPNGTIRFYDPQTGKIRTWDELKKRYC